MRVAELLKLLQELPQEAEVITEGCDCNGDVAEVTLDADGDVYLCRSHEERPSSKPVPDAVLDVIEAAYLAGKPVNMIVLHPENTWGMKPPDSGVTVCDTDYGCFPVQFTTTQAKNAVTVE